MSKSGDKYTYQRVPECTKSQEVLRGRQTIRDCGQRKEELKKTHCQSDQKYQPVAVTKVMYDYGSCDKVYTRCFTKFRCPRQVPW